MTKVVDGKIYFNPAYDEVTNLIVSGVKELVENYNISAIHFDDYFYPTQNKNFDKRNIKDMAEICHLRIGADRKLRIWLSVFMML